MRALGYSLLGLITGTAAGFWLGLMFGLIYADFAQVSCFDGQCSALAARVGAGMAALGGLFGASLGLRRAGEFIDRSSTHLIA